MVATQNQFLYSYLFIKYRLSCADIARAFGESRQNVNQIINRAEAKSLQNTHLPDFQKISFGQPPKISIARNDRQCPHCSARPGPRISINTNEPRRDLDLLRDKSGGLCHKCGWSF
jgi:hypothetical protein